MPSHQVFAMRTPASPHLLTSARLSGILRWAGLLGCVALLGCAAVKDVAKQQPSVPIGQCYETGPYACQSGETEPLYTFQWDLDYAHSYFQTHSDAGAYGGGYDLNIAPVHRKGYKGQGVKALVIDSGVDLAHEDLAENADLGMSWNFATGASDPHPLLTKDKQAHGTNVAGIIAAAQNGRGMMGVAPRSRIGGVALVLQGDAVQTEDNIRQAYGGAPWSAQADVINASFGVIHETERYDPQRNVKVAGVRHLKTLRSGKGAIFVKAAGNAFDDLDKVNLCGALTGYYDCTNPANDAQALEPNAIVTAALNAKGQASSYSSAGSMIWVTGLGDESGEHGNYGEASGLTAEQIAQGRTGDGPTLFATDISGCDAGPAAVGAGTAFMRGESEQIAGVKDNPRCDYASMNGTSVAAPTISGLAAVLLSVNPELSWRDVRDILRLSARAIDQGYEKRTRSDVMQTLNLPYNSMLDLRSNSLLKRSGAAADLVKPGVQAVPVELGWQTNAAGSAYANWYGFGLPDAEKAVHLALRYKTEPALRKPAAQSIPAFVQIAHLKQLRYQRVSLLGEFMGGDGVVDSFQLRLDGKQVCLGALGIAVQSPAGTVSLLKLPLDHFAGYGESDFEQYGLGSHAFYGEPATGRWKVFALAANPSRLAGNVGANYACTGAPKKGTVARNLSLQVQARIIAQ